MLTKEKRDMLSIIYGDDLKTMGDTVVAYDETTKMSTVIDYDGNLLVENPVHAIGYVLGPRGFHYVLLTKKYMKLVQEKVVRPSGYIRSSKYYVGTNGTVTPAITQTEETEYEYQIYSSKFEYEAVGRVRPVSSTIGISGGLGIDIFGKIVTLWITNGILVDKYPYVENLDMPYRAVFIDSFR